MKRFVIGIGVLICLLCGLFAPCYGAYPTTTEHHKLYPYTSVMASPYSCDNTGVVDCAASVELIKANQSNTGTIHIPKGTFKIGTNLTIPAGMRLHFESGAYFSIANGVVLTINGAVSGDDDHQVFTLVGTGSVVLGISKEYNLSGFSSLSAALTFIGSTSSTLVIDKDLTISVDTSILANVSIAVRNGAVFTIDTGKTLTISGTLDAGPYQIFSCTGTGKVLGLKESKPVWFGAAMTGSGDDSAAFALAFAAADTVVASGITAGDIVFPSSKTLVCDKLQINGTFDCTLTQNSSVQGKLTIIPPTGSTFGMKWRKTRYCDFNEVVIGDTVVGTPTYDGIGLYITGGENNGSYYNNIGKLTIGGMKSWGISALTDTFKADGSTPENLYRIGSNRFGMTQIQWCSNGISLLGATNNVFTYLGLEQNAGTIWQIKATPNAAPSHGNKFYGVYQENPGLTTLFDFVATEMVGTVFEGVNDLGTMPSSIKNANSGIIWHGTGAWRSLGSLQTWGEFGLYNSTEAFPRTKAVQGLFSFGNGTADPSAAFGYQAAGVVGAASGTNLGTGAGTVALTNQLTSTAGAITISSTKGYNWITLTENITSITFPTAVDGKRITLRIKQAAAGGYTVAGWPASVLLAGGAYTATATASKTDVLQFQYEGATTKWVEVSRSQNM